ncbi:alpha/beta hydrolase-fold protein [Paracoccus sp. 1_MG-2023]|uniref:alpha/beta hydrolase n=1 Tax=unclassified Paracoccus (in: a-proteobacteria) TaxID=2688777 RepID=UPI001C09F5D0|nr:MULTISPECIES: alpha/beta hydrolase-fold protein [unclassified Paracoccus (in: a-proteobacteria)]MBU2958856.1 esterase family protein [Paracoccus sp. C2R09]MDO6670013.1 alpha/beta hydrolase-fold protein [Paracoccus sp. 1_MG-2023]
MKPASLIGTLATFAILASPLRAEVRMQNAIGSEVLGRPVGYSVYLPPGYGRDRRDYPVLYLLHGGGTGQPSDWFTLAGIDQMLDRMIADGQIRPLIAVAPDGRRDEANVVATYFLDDANGETLWRTMFLTEFIPAIEQKYPTIGSGDGRAVLGISMGAVAGIVYQLHEPTMFAGVAALSPAFRTDAQLLALSDEGYAARYEGVLGAGLTGPARMNDIWEALRPSTLTAGADTARLGRIPRIWIDIGADDPFFEGAADLHVALRDAGVVHDFTVTRGGHDWPFWRGALQDALVHVDAVLTRGYGE